MSLLFYSRPDFVAKMPGPLGLAQCQAYVDKTQKHRKAIPTQLSFDNVIQDKALPPCTLDDFMQYLVHVSHDAENLQFWLWLQDYIKRFFVIPPSEQVLSPPWVVADVVCTPAKVQETPSSPSRKQNSGAAGKVPGLESLGDTKPSGVAPPFNMDSLLSAGVCADRPVIESVGDANTQAGLNWQAFTIQPFRSEINNVISHYLAPDSPRELNLSQRDRAAVLHALQHTTHPSALAAIGDVVENNLRGQSHPNFIRWSICNGNKPRVLAVRNCGIAHIAAGLVVGILLVLSSQSRWWRLFMAPLFLIGFSIGVAAHKGLCVIIHSSHTRALRPWEQFGDTIASAYVRVIPDEERPISRDDHSMTTHPSSKNVSFDPFGKADTDEYGSTWSETYEKTPVMRKILTPKIWIQDRTIRMLQDRIVVQSHCISALITIPLMTFFLVLPESSIF